MRRTWADKPAGAHNNFMYLSGWGSTAGRFSLAGALDLPFSHPIGQIRHAKPACPVSPHEGLIESACCATMTMRAQLVRVLLIFPALVCRVGCRGTAR